MTDSESEYGITITRNWVAGLGFLMVGLGMCVLVHFLKVEGPNPGPVENDVGQISTFTEDGLPEWMLRNKDKEILDVEAADGGLYILYILYWKPEKVK